MQLTRPAGFTPYELDTYDGAYQDLPSVDDLEVAAAAAAAAMEAVDMISSPAESDEEVCFTARCFDTHPGLQVQHGSDARFMPSIKTHFLGNPAIA